MEHTQQLPGLDDFLTALRFEGIPIGPQELVWLQHAFSLAPSLDRQSLHDLLACALLKEASHRTIFEALFDDWCPFDDSAGATAEEGRASPQARVPELPSHSIGPEPPATSAPATTSRRSWRPWLIIFLVMVVAGLAYAIVRHLTTGPTPVSLPPVTASPVESLPPPGAADLAADPVAQFRTWVPTFDIPPPPLVNPMWLAVALAGLALCGGVFLGWRYWSRNVIPPPETSPVAGPAWFPLPTPDPTGPALLNRDALRAAVWGVERFVSEEDETRVVELANTVAATAQAGGLPTIRFAPAVYPREVWFWRDAMVQDLTLDRVLAELENSLSLAGLPVRCGTFVDTPALVRWRDGQELSALALEGHRQSALVVILTDGYGMRLAAQSELEKHTLANLLRAFGEWPRLTFVDCSNGAHGLATQVQAYGLHCMAPEDIPTWLGAGPAAPVAKRRAEAALLGDLRVWAAATALAPEPMSADSAFALRVRLGLELSPWAFRDLLGVAESGGERLAWSPVQRARLLNWLRQCSQEHGKVADASPLARALDYWIARYREASTQREEHQNALLPWQRTPAEQRVRMEIALLELWRDPIAATTTLYRLGRTLGEEIRERLALLAASDRQQERPDDPDDVVSLPWKEADQPASVRWMLARLGFGSSAARDIGELRLPMQLSLALGVCAGLVIVALGTALWWRLAPALPVVRPVLPRPLQAVVIQDVQRSSPGAYRLVVGTPKQWRGATVPAHSRLDIQWRWQAQDNVEKFGQSELWRAGTLPQALRGCEASWPRRSLVVIQAEPTALPARQLAIRLLDRGSADAVLLGTDWAAHVDKLIQGEVVRQTDQQLVLILPPGASAPVLPFQGLYGVLAATDLQALATRLDFAGIRPLPEVWGNAQTNGRVPLRGGPEETTDPRTGITFVKVCGGTFTMGSDEYDDEKPPHPVTLSAFELSTTEITNAHYRRFRKDHQGDDTLPAVNVSWSEAKTFCESYGYALPTEAQWEYAARGGSTTRWSFGDDEAQLGDYAWFGEKLGSALHPVRMKRPNPLGLYDMHGNAWEWVADCYDENAYQNRSVLIVDPKVGGSCKFRARRGGSAWGGDPGVLRSASRGRLEPEDRDDGIGFRCVRGPRRQP